MARLNHSHFRAVDLLRLEILFQHQNLQVRELYKKKNPSLKKLEDFNQEFYKHIKLH